MFTFRVQGEALLSTTNFFVMVLRTITKKLQTTSRKSNFILLNIFQHLLHRCFQLHIFPTEIILIPHRYFNIRFQL